MGADEASIRFEDDEILPDRDRGDAELGRQIADSSASVFRDDPDDVFLSLAGEDIALGRVGGNGHASPPASAGGTTRFRMVTDGQ
jgi:hypothetical protein